GAIQALQRAVEADSAFALAHYRLTTAAWWAERHSLADAALERALRHGAGLAEHDRLLIQAAHAFRRGSHAEGERLYRQIVAAYPDDVEAWYELGEVVLHTGAFRGQSLSDAREPFERAVALDPQHMAALTHLTNVAAAEGKKAELDSLTRRVLAIGGQEQWELRAQAAFALADTAEQARVLAEIRRRGDGGIAPFYVAWSAGDFDGARRMIRLYVDRPTRSPGERAASHILLARLELASGRWRAAQAELDATSALDSQTALEVRALLAASPFLDRPRVELARLRDALLSWQPRAVPRDPSARPEENPHGSVHAHLRLYLLGLLNARLGEDAPALRYASEVEALGGPTAARLFGRDLAQAIRAEVARGRGDAEGALAALDQAPFWTHEELDERYSIFFAHGHELLLRADLLFQLGRLEEALRWYAAVGGHNPLIYRAPSHLRRAEIYERLGQPQRAAEHYARFIELWQECDPELRPLVENAERRLAVLARER
ncbi:MAG: tetratricopeptide repeat protein, partial [Gemmatimonadetes bacterium]|nr:tetratricopeptide repeat protein [Gemmatimonadota bacterium]